MTFHTLSQKWLEAKRNFIKPSTYALYSYCISHYLDTALGKRTIHQLTENCIQQTILDFQTKPSCRKACLKKSTVRNLLVLIKQILAYAMRLGICPVRAFSIYFAKCNHRTDSRTLTLTEQGRLVRLISANASPKAVGILLSISMGLRIGEVCALRWRDFDLNEQTLTVEHTVQRLPCHADKQKKTTVVMGDAKTLSSCRILPLSDEVLTLLKALPQRNANDFVVSASEKLVEPRTLRRFYQRFCEKNGIRYLRFHALRHSFATRSIEHGVDCKTVSEILGHANVATTLNLYVHPSMAEKRRCVNLIKLCDM